MKGRALQHEDGVIPYRVRHRASVTRRIHLRTEEDGSLLIIAPRRMSRRAIHTALQSRVNRVVKFLDEARRKLEETPRPQFIDGEQHLYLGRLYPIRIISNAGGRNRVQLSSGTIRLLCSRPEPTRLANLLETWYRARATEAYADRISMLSRRACWIENTPPIRLRKMKRTWGSCSARGIITLNTRLIKTPPACIDYVIAHELCHLKEMNHGNAFYALQEQIYPDWRRERAFLKERAHIYLA
jgi:predicted metal-dependent hydrolase